MSNINYSNFLTNLLVQPISELYHLLFFQIYKRCKNHSEKGFNINIIFQTQLSQTNQWDKVKSLNNQENSKFTDMKKYMDDRISHITDVDIQKLLKLTFLAFTTQDAPEYSTFILKLFDFISLRIIKKIESYDINDQNADPIFLQNLSQDIEYCIQQTIIHFLPLNKILEDAEKAKETSLSMSPYKAKLTTIHANQVKKNPEVISTFQQMNFPNQQMNFPNQQMNFPNQQMNFPNQQMNFPPPQQANLPQENFNNYNDLPPQAGFVPHNHNSKDNEQGSYQQGGYQQRGYPQERYPQDIYEQEVYHNPESLINVENKFRTNPVKYQEALQTSSNRKKKKQIKEASESHIHLSQVKSATDKSKKIIESFGTLNMSNLDGTASKSKTIRLGSASKV